MTSRGPHLQRHLVDLLLQLCYSTLLQLEHVLLRLELCRQLSNVDHTGSVQGQESRHFVGVGSRTHHTRPAATIRKVIECAPFRPYAILEDMMAQ